MKREMHGLRKQAEICFSLLPTCLILLLHLQNGDYSWVELCPLNSFVGVLAPGTSELTDLGIG